MHLGTIKWSGFLRGVEILTLVAVILCFVFVGRRAAAQNATTTVPPLRHVVIVIGENAGYSQTYSSGAMPYLDSLAAKYGLATNYIADTHPSIGNYFAFSSGQILSNNDSLTPSQQTFSVDNIALDVQNTGETWKDYVEEDPNTSGCGALVSGNYYYRHDPLEYYSNINRSNIVCFSQFATDLKNKALPNLSWLVPNGYDDGHDSSPGAFDSWLKTEIAPLLASSYFQSGGDGLLIVAFDENSNTGGSGCSTSQIESGTWCGGQVETVIVSPAIVSAGYQSTNEYHHENVLRLMEEALGSNDYPGASSDPHGALSVPIDMSDFFAQGTTSGSVTLSPTSLTFASQTVGTTSPAQTETLNNATSAAVSISGIAISGTNAGDFAETNNCGSSVAAGSTCSIGVTFTPSTTASESATLTVNDGSGSQMAGLAGTGASAPAPVVSLSPTSLTFASQTIGTTSPGQSVALSNTGNAALSISGIAISGADSGDFAETNNCGSSVAAGSRCAISVTFTPAVSGTLTASLIITDSASGSPQSVGLTGSGASLSGGGGGSGSTNNYYVSTTGSDTSGSGTAASPWATIAHAATLIGPGAVVHVAAGVYTGSFNTSASGTSTAPIKYQADTADFSGPVNCAQVSANHGSLSSCVQLVGTSGSAWDNSGDYVTIQGFDITGPNIGVGTSAIATNGQGTRFIGNSVHDVETGSCGSSGNAAIGADGVDGVVDGNYVYNVGQAGCGTTQGIYPNSGSSGGTTIIENNIVFQVSGFGIQSWANTGGDIIVNNTVFNTGDGCVVIGTDTQGQTNGNDFVANNICYATPGGIREEGYSSAATGTNNVYEDNLFYKDTTNYSLQNGLVGTGTVTADPLFVNYTGDQTGNYHLQSNSPAIGIGTSTNAPTADFDGNTRPQSGAWDIGAYEYVGGGGGTSNTQNFVISSSPASASVNAGSTASYTISVSPLSTTTLPATVTLSCSGLPSNTSCSFSPATVTLTSGPETSTLTISTMASPSTAAAQPFWPHDPTIPFLATWIGALFLFAIAAFYAKRSKKQLGFAVASSVMLLSLLVPVVSCSAPGVSPQSAGTPPGTYQFTVNGQSGQSQQTANLTLIVK